MKTGLYSALALAAALVAAPASAEIITYNGAGFSIPDVTNHTSTINVTDTRAVQGVTFTLNGLTHTYLGDLFGKLGHNGAESVFFDRGTDSGSDLNGSYTFSDAARATQLNGSQGSPVPSGTFAPFTPLSVFNGASAAGAWVLTLNDEVAGDVGNLSSWSLSINYRDATAAVPEPATWAMMILGMGAIGGLMRRRKAQGTLVLA